MILEAPEEEKSKQTIGCQPREKNQNGIKLLITKINARR